MLSLLFKHFLNSSIFFYIPYNRLFKLFLLSSLFNYCCILYNLSLKMHSSSLAHCFIQLSSFYYIYFNILFCEMFPHSTHDVRLSLGPASETVELPLRLPKKKRAGPKAHCGAALNTPPFMSRNCTPPSVYLRCPPASPFPSPCPPTPCPMPATD